MTPAEAALWARLRGKQLGVKFRCQHPCFGYIADFASIRARLIIELDGEWHAGRERQDAMRSKHLAKRGYRVLRFPNQRVLTDLDGVVACIAQAITARSQPEARP